MFDNVCVKPTFSIVETTKIGATIGTRLLKTQTFIPLAVIFVVRRSAPGFVNLRRHAGQVRLTLYRTPLMKVGRWPAAIAL